MSKSTIGHKKRLKASSPDTQMSPSELYLNSLAASGRRPMGIRLNHCAHILGHRGSTDSYDWAKLTFEKVHQVRTQLIEMEYSVNTTNMTIAAIRGVVKAAFNLGQMSADDMLRINAIRPLKGSTSSRKGRCLPRNELQQLIQACSRRPSKAQQLRDHALLLVGAGAGLRCAELCALQAEDIYLSEERLVVENGKGRKQRQLFLAPKLVDALRSWMEYRGSQPGPLFLRILRDSTITDSGLTASGVTHALKFLQELADIPPFTPHDLRRTFITDLLEQGIDINTVRQLAGHSDISTTIRYDKRDEQWQKQASQSLTF